uniref:prostaglandin G/H synthase 2-like n=1 Tax=Styela clava TaxID=7725 RepID=UPI00193A515E|nr:prostaglandin G/H synthase 2-like [Styela clava]
MAITKAVFFMLILEIVAIRSCKSNEIQYNPCCSFPCQNNGICYTKGFDDYICECTRTGYYGRHCETAEFSTRIKKFFKPSRDTLQHLVTNYKYLWYIVNKTDWLKKAVMGLVLKVRMSIVDEPTAYIGWDDYTTWETYTNKSVYARTLHPVPKNCPTPMGVKGKKELPNPELLAKKFLLRRKFLPCPRNTNVLFPFFAQHFNHQYFKTDFSKGIPFQWGSHYVDISHIYGDTDQRQHALRSHQDGKMKVSIFNGEAFPPRLEDTEGLRMAGSQFIKKEHRLAFGHKGFAAMPTFLLYSTLWIREHNRVCDILKVEHPEWDDERLFQTTRLIITGETIKIIIEDYVQHLSGFHFQLLYDPDILMNEGMSHHNQIHIEFHSLYHWHALMPDNVVLEDKSYKIKELLFNPEPIIDAGLQRTFQDLNTQFAGQVAGGKNQGSGTLAVAVQAIKDGRSMRLQSFNNYRKKIGLKPYTTFEDFTGEKEMAAELKELYGDIDALELYLGLMTEKRRKKQLFGETLTEMGSPYSLKGLYGSPLGSPGWWKPVTFGGDVGFNIVKTASLQKLICDNVEGCPTVAFRVPSNHSYEESDMAAVPDDNTSDTMMALARGKEPPNNSQESSNINKCDNLKNGNCDSSKSKMYSASQNKNLEL